MSDVDAVAANAAQPGSPLSARERAFYAWWVPHTARDCWLGCIDRDTALRVLCNVCRGTLPEYECRPGALDHLLGQHMDRLADRWLEARIAIGRAIDPLLDGLRPPAEIRAAADRVAASHGFGDVDLDVELADRVAAWKWRQKRLRAA